MRERVGSMAVQVVVVMVVVMKVTANPTAVTTHQPAGSTIEPNHVEDQYLDDALGHWLDNLGTYTFMVKQDLDTHAGDADEEGGEGGQEVDVEAAINDVEGDEVREVEEEEVEEWSAPIAVSTGSKSLLDPHHDYLVTVESLVAEEGSIFLTLSKYDNQTTCGVGGLSLEEEERQGARRAAGGGLDVAQGSSSDGGDYHTTFIAFGPQQGNATSSDTSKWIDVSDQYWWSRGQLAGGGMLSISFTPPECGCLALSTYFALPAGNLMLVVGPQAYPDELQILLCVDPIAGVPDHEYDDDKEEDDEEEAVDYLQQPSALVASRNPGEAETETETEESPEQQPTVASRKRKMSKEEKKMAKKTRRQMKRQKIRQAGRRQARQQARQQGQAGGGRKTSRRWNRKKNQRKKTRVWEKLHKRGRKAGRRNHHHHEEVNGTEAENMTHHHQHVGHGLNTSTTNQQEERLVDILLRDALPAGNTTLEDEMGEESAAGEEGEVAVANEEEVEGEGEEPQTPRQRRKNRRQRNKMMRKQKRKVYPPGVKFCCKQGVKHKKSIMEVDSTSGNSPGSCNMSINVVSTFAHHQFGIEVATCTTTFTTCCTRFTDDMWEGIKAKKEARRTERKERRKSRRQGRKQRRKQERRHRKGMKKQSHAHHHDHEACTGEGDACAHAK